MDRSWAVNKMSQSHDLSMTFTLREWEFWQTYFKESFYNWRNGLKIPSSLFHLSHCMNVCIFYFQQKDYFGQTMENRNLSSFSGCFLKTRMVNVTQCFACEIKNYTKHPMDTSLLLIGCTPLKPLQRPDFYNQICQVDILLKCSSWMFSPLLSDAMEVKFWLQYS